jgi:NAD(P)-dependent dehydrogenase (short-subunit alcohol dehydrogenase family)
VALDSRRLDCFLNAATRSLEQAGIRALPESTPAVEMLPLDVRADDSVPACVDAVVNRSGRLDVLINNAGYELAGALEELSSEEARAQFETNFFGVVRMVDAVLPLMRRQKRGHIINVSSLSGLSAIPFLGVYSARKFALVRVHGSLTPRSQAVQHSRVADGGGLSENPHDESSTNRRESARRVRPMATTGSERHSRS